MTDSNPRTTAWRVARAVLLPLLLVSLSSVAVDAAAEYPDRPVHIVVPVPPGGPTDGLARVLAEKLGELWKQPVVIDNKPGAQNVIGTDWVARAAPDGYTLLLLVDSTVTMLPFRKQKLPYDPKSLVAVTTLTDTPFLVVISSGVKAQSLADLVQVAKERPGQVSIGIGTFAGQAIAAQFSSLAQIRLLPVFYKGGSDLTAALVSGNIDLSLLPYVSIQPFLGTGKIKVLASTGAARSAATPDVPTLTELGYPGFETGVWLGLAAPAGTPDKLVQKLSADVGKVMEMPDVVARLRAMGSTPMPGNPASVAELIRVHSEKWKPIVPTLTLE